MPTPASKFQAEGLAQPAVRAKYGRLLENRRFRPNGNLPVDRDIRGGKPIRRLRHPLDRESRDILDGDLQMVAFPVRVDAAVVPMFLEAGHGQPEHLRILQRAALPMDGAGRAGLPRLHPLMRPGQDLLERVRMIFVPHARPDEMLKRLALGLIRLGHDVCREFLSVLFAAVRQHGNIEQVSHIARHVVLPPERLRIARRHLVGGQVQEAFHIDEPRARRAGRTNDPHNAPRCATPPRRPSRTRPA